MWNFIRNSRVYKSIFRYSYPADRRNRIMTVAKNVFLHLHPNMVPRGAIRVTYTWCLGGLSFMLFLILTVTGVLLMFYYRPATAVAYQDMKDLETVVTFGMLLRNMHRYSAHAMVILVFLHMGRTFFFGAYKYPRELNWVIGAVLLILTMVMGFTGYLLPFDQRSYWATVVGVNINGTGPIVGPYLSTSCAPAPRSARRHWRASTRSTCCCCRARSSR